MLVIGYVLQSRKANEYFNSHSAFNFPFQLTLGPVIGDIAAGNTVVIKPSETTPRSATLMQKIVGTLDPSCYKIIQGAIPETQALLAERWDQIFFTGSANVGRIVSKATAPHLTPVILEPGGINPAILSRNANPRLVSVFRLAYKGPPQRPAD